MYVLSETKSNFLKLIAEALKRRGLEVEEEELERLAGRPPSPEMGDLGVSLFRYAKKLGLRPEELTSELKGEIEGRLAGVKEVKAIGGFLNVELEPSWLAERALREASREDYGKWSFSGRLVVEHTSANPVHPLHVGHARNMFLGDSLVRILKNWGADVQSRFYINDMGRQVAVLVYGLLKLGRLEPPEGEKPDHWYGKVYSVANALVELNSPSKGDDEKKEWEEVLKELESKWPEIVREMKEKFDDEDPEAKVSELMKKYEEGDPEVKETFRKVVNEVLKGFKETMERVGVNVDKWDWESDLVWSGEVDKIINMAKEKGLVIEKDGALVMVFKNLNDEVRRRLRIPKGLQIPPLVLKRSDGTTLYTTRDIAYTIKKFEEFRADRVINVIAAEQRLPQIQLRLALWELGFKEYAENLIHYAYEMVNVPGMKMSGRRGRMITLDWLLDEAERRVRELVEGRSEAEDVDEVVKKVAVGAVKFAMVSVSPEKPITFKWEEVLNFERNSAPYLQYTYARAVGILRKGGEPDLERADYSKAEKYKDMILSIAEFPEVARKAAEDLKPDLIATYLLSLADKFNEFYHKEPVAKEPDEGLRNLKLALVKAVANTIRRGLWLLGVEAPARM
ncbi:arginine--tRNA ligase [Ignicoccus hospitalis]|uniref:Arginine--tRNA ligase n=1 Tax=Ignicoccus hospitalis (strain KIN4/I / DSM 18386 / JCM 14125) TaxID=453591 RepID=SYR_IGNH4|nr:arginine--tRNA ligase [Ignicoccus hospitalis]A8AB06.1 RecName: Full=Arginine--tRNA ligase; AltName: Full=Arginyl-tRNA synthetase; Short=ArgRS [Ignicoccus hospitalis KIN4/I]ABU82108.1 arginyl-tRNA synthetase [Ignicoccus hospitalis KIN4/I]HIH91066.1 arginine--tRNA ligase [Desulfurococcaceae archaeon]